MRTTLFQAEMEEKRLVAVYQDTHPRLRQVREQVNAAKTALNKLERESKSLNTTPNPLRLKLEEDLVRAKTSLVGLRTLHEKTLMQKTEKEKEIRELLDFDVELSRVNRDLSAAQSALTLMRDKQEQSRVVDNLRKKRISSINVSQPASFIEKPSSPKKPLIVAASLALGLGTGLALVFLREFSRKTLRRPDEAEQKLGYPVLVSVPNSSRLKLDYLSPRKNAYKSLRSRRMHQMSNSCRELMSELYLTGGRSSSSGDSVGRSVGIVGVSDGCGASTLAMILAMESSEVEGLRTTLVDLDLRKRTISNVFGLNTEVSSVEPSGAPPYMQQLTKNSLSLVGSPKNVGRKAIDNPLSIAEMLKELTSANDLVIVDLPPADRPSNLFKVAAHLDQIIVVIESETTELQAAQRLIRKFEKINADVVGTIINKSNSYVPSWLERLIG
jgi:polysaccharide biosynthesis transport protein